MTAAARLVQIIARRRFNFIDGVMFTWVTYFIATESYWAAGAVFFGSLVLSIAFEGAARSERFRNDKVDINAQ